ncbi:hypothetical protein MHO82_24590 [Vibrio sp. Of7-15]|uniref:hypothetical protein n=1 Tax=Vibrio sp. Of7-15 TaxID=2724879 RepID=UPI001EF18EFC|nr:hypothetical protein [Vibrio sp. Of7-15]MCG7500046.1 hypothetical protein [Vibrio sp. Of7-15]
MDVTTLEEETLPQHTDADEHTETHSQQVESDFLSSLDEDDFEPEDMPSKADQKMELQAASGLALGGLMAVEGGMKMMLHPDFTFDAKQANNVAEKVAPLILKYGANPPDWVKEYMQEIIAAFAIGSLAFGSVMQVRQLKAADLEKAKQEAEAKQAQTDAEAA